MNLEGEIGELELIPRLIELGSQAFTGALRFENDSVIKIVYFKEGNILSASTNDRADSIDEILLRSGKVTRDHVKQALSKRKETETLGDALLGLGFIAKRELAWARRVQLIGILRSIGEWKSGSFTIVADYLPKREEGTAFALPQIVLELILTDQDRSKYEKALESGAAVFRKSGSFETSFPSLGLNQEAEAITSGIDGVRTAAEIAAESGSEAFNVYKLLNALNLLGLVQKAENSLDVSPAVQSQGVGGFDSPAEPTVEMSLNFGRGAVPMDLAGELTPPAPLATSEYEIPPRDADSSVPREALDRYSFDAPVVDESPDIGIGYHESAVPAPAAKGIIRASTSEGLGSIESLRNFEVSKGSFPSIEAQNTPPEKKQPLSVPPRRRDRKRGLVAAAAIGAFVVSAAAVWFYLESTRRAEGTPEAVSRPATTATGAPEIVTQTESATSTSVVAELGTAPPVTETASPLASAPPDTATTALPSNPLAVATTTRTPAPGAVPQPAAQRLPLADPPAQTAPSPSRYAAQAQQYVRDAATVPFTVQFALVCRDASIENSVRIGGSKLWYVPTTYRGESCYKVYWGRYATREQAERGIGEIPASLRGGKPTVISPGASNR